MKQEKQNINIKLSILPSDSSVALVRIRSPEVITTQSKFLLQRIKIQMLSVLAQSLKQKEKLVSLTHISH